MIKRMEFIGLVENDINSPMDPFELRKHESTIVVEPKYLSGLMGLDKGSLIQVFFYFDQSVDYKLQHFNYSGDFKGLFATRTPNRPSGIGMSTVKILKIRDNKLIVTGLDALNNTPVFDIKPFVKTFDTDELLRSDEKEILQNPRKHIQALIRHDNLCELLLMTGQIHGHFCRGVTIGVIAAYLGVKYFSADGDGLEDIVAIVEVNSCMVDGIQFVGGFTLGNNGLIYRDIGKTAVTFVKRKSGRAVRYFYNRDYAAKMAEKNAKKNAEKATKKAAKKDADNDRSETSGKLSKKDIFYKVVNQNIRTPELLNQFREIGMAGALEMLDYDFEKLFNKQEFHMKLPEHAKLFDSFECDSCHEMTMITRKIERAGKALCPTCGGTFMEASGNGINHINDINHINGINLINRVEKNRVEKNRAEKIGEICD